MTKRYSIDEVFALIGEDVLNTPHYSKGQKNSENTIQVDGYDVYTHSLRYMTFYQKGCKCVACGKEGTHFTLDAGDGKDTRRHFNLRAEDGTLMTRDHILPKSKGGRDHICNMQTMCVDCNKAKGNTYEGELPEKVRNIIAVHVDNSEKIMTYEDENFAIFQLLNRSKVTQAVTNKNKLGAKLRKTVEITMAFLNCLNNEIPYHNYFWYTKDKYEEKYNELDKSVIA